MLKLRPSLGCLSPRVPLQPLTTRQPGPASWYSGLCPCLPGTVSFLFLSAACFPPALSAQGSLKAMHEMLRVAHTDSHGPASAIMHSVELLVLISWGTESQCGSVSVLLVVHRDKSQQPTAQCVVLLPCSPAEGAGLAAPSLQRPHLTAQPSAVRTAEASSENTCVSSRGKKMCLRIMPSSLTMIVVINA